MTTWNSLQPSEPSLSEMVGQPQHVGDNVIAQVEHDGNPLRCARRFMGPLALSAAGVLCVSQYNSGAKGANIGHMPYSTLLSEAVNGMDDVLAVAGTAGIAAAGVYVIGGKIAARKSPRQATIDAFSSRELTPHTLSAKPSKHKKSLATSAAIAAAITSLFVGIGREIETGPSRPIAEIGAQLPGGKDAQLVVESDDAMPMVQSSISGGLTSRIVAAASKRKVAAVPFTEDLATYRDTDGARSALGFGLAVDKKSPLYWDTAMGCDAIPVIVDAISGRQPGDKVTVQGHVATVAGTTKDISASNRLGVLYSTEVSKQCFQKGTSANYGVVLGTDAQTAAQILAESRPGQEAAATISMRRYDENSKDFWSKNVIPLTNLLTVLTTMSSFAAVSREISMRLLRTRRELSSLLLATSTRTVQTLETARVVKNNAYAAAVGAVGSVFLSPVVSGTVFATQTTIGLKEMLAGVGAVTVATVGSLAKHVWRGRQFVKALDPARSVR